MRDNMLINIIISFIVGVGLGLVFLYGIPNYIRPTKYMELFPVGTSANIQYYQDGRCILTRVTGDSLDLDEEVCNLLLQQRIELKKEGIEDRLIQEKKQRRLPGCGGEDEHGH